MRVEITEFMFFEQNMINTTPGKRPDNIISLQIIPVASAWAMLSANIHFYTADIW